MDSKRRTQMEDLLENNLDGGEEVLPLSAPPSVVRME